jgi:hypothetical protein
MKVASCLNDLLQATIFCPVFSHEPQAQAEWMISGLAKE